ncbi:hypothetical protein AVI51_13520 [Piscirickettsia salmonis]|uniref:Uncharacterized protein n=1 Tax=Piscirickettsia salmonis TaxID=1238 RepID=A0A9Q5VIW2_PISSA|nr:DUF4402 domain-containing protein [Piscirickettsia salmonis]ALA24042.1 hypothetical protein KW89_573 [Piscirickettsia salmonis]APS44447.1 hypothetical protein AVI48_08780 [Piscirickettsia salmonis]APS47807.1 hypothetical protein AVI49_09385 [Piscirickettsia salmonis]APS51765.1 hypothetical protein AVI50_13640 [Piscirickettsia salmonis]APS54984.1 hypothetical protein AVI51_13520 [Piscirickettsia salmonis]
MSMKKSFIGVTAFLVATSVNSFAAESATGKLNITAKIVSGIAIEQTTAMAFGDIVLPNKAGVKEDASADGQMTVYGTPGSAVKVTWPAKTDINSGSDSLEVSVVTKGGGKSDAKDNLDEDGQLAVDVTGTIKDLMHDTVAGDYAGTLTFTAAYQ